MESFFLAETIKYLYLIFDEENFLHANGEFATEHRTPSGKLRDILSAFSTAVLSSVEQVRAFWIRAMSTIRKRIRSILACWIAVRR